MKKRLLFYTIEKYLESKEALVITGMRQVGKTTLIKQVFDEIKSPSKLYFDLDNPLDQKIFEDIDYRNMYNQLKSISGNQNSDRLYVFIDEIQNLPVITKVIKFLIDHYKVKFIVTGSSNYYLRNLFPESLSGRKFLFELPPLSFKECLYFKDKIDLKQALSSNLNKSLKPLGIFEFKKFESDYEEYLKYGGFPQVILTKSHAEKIQILKNIFTSFFEHDIKTIKDYKDIKTLRDILVLLVPRTGSVIDITKLASELETNRPAVYSYLELLQGTYMIKLLPKFSKSIDRAVAGRKKVYFRDTGLLNIIGMVNDGQLFENAVVNQLNNFGKLSFFSQRNTSEIDIILNNHYAFEVKLKGTIFDLKKVKKISKRLGLKKTFVISKSSSEEKNILPPTNF